MSLHHFSFGAPLFLFALLVVPLAVGFGIAIRRRRARYTAAYTNLGLLSRLAATRRPAWRRWVPLALLALALAAAAAALARPRIDRVQRSDGVTVVLLADVSGSMEATDVKPSRLLAAIQAMHDFVGRLPANDQVGLVAFSDTVQVIHAPTTDHVAVDSGLDTLTPEGGTALGDAVEAAVRIIVTSLAASGVHYQTGGYLPAAIVLESDGAQDRGTVTPSTAAQVAAKAGVRIYGIALGTRHGYVGTKTGLLTQAIQALPDPGTVALLARETGGHAYDAKSAAQLDSVYKHLGSAVGSRNEPTQITSWFLLASAIFLVAGVAVARLRGGALP